MSNDPKSEKKKKASIPMEAWERTLIAVIGSLIIALSLVVLYVPPNLKIEETQKGLTSTKTTDTEPDKWTVTALIAGIGLVAYGINGRKIMSFSTSLIDVTTTSEGQSQEPGTQGAMVAQSDAVVQFNAAFAEFMRRYLTLSSWIGLKVLLICLLSSRTGKRFNLRAICADNQSMSFDYALAYLVSSASLGIFIYESEPTFSWIKTRNFAQHIAGFLEPEIQLRIDNRPESAEDMRGEINRIKRRFGAA
jgi:hypothetical protein